MLALLVRLQDGLAESEISALAPRQRELVERLEQNSLVRRALAPDGVRYLWLDESCAVELPAAPALPETHTITAEQLQTLGLRATPGFKVRRRSDRHIGRPPSSIGAGPFAYLERLPPEDFDPLSPDDLQETVLALLAFDGLAARALVEDNLGLDWSFLRDRIREEKLEGRARYLGLHKLIHMRFPRRTRAKNASSPPAIPVQPKEARRDAYRRASTEPKDKRPSRARR